MSPPVGIYRNVPAMPRAKLAKDEKNGRSRAEEANNQRNVVWGGGGSRRDDDAGATSAITPLNPYSANGKGKENRNWTDRRIL